jgi:hypothetical protein
MRLEILAEIRALNIAGYTISDELPWDSSGTPLYLRNKRTVYASEPNVEDSVVINTIDGARRLFGRQRSTSVYLAVDAKQKPANYDQLVQGILDIQSLFRDFYEVAVELVNTLESDTLLAEIEFRTTELRKI